MELRSVRFDGIEAVAFLRAHHTSDFNCELWIEFKHVFFF